MKYALGNMLNGAGGLNADQLALDLQFATDKTLTARKGPTPTFTRASSGTFVGNNGLIQSAGNNVARFDHDPVTLASKGLLIEESRTNLLIRSAELTSTAWTTANLTGTSVLAPDGTNTATSFNDGTSLGEHTIYGSFSPSNRPTTGAVSCTLSCFLKAGTVRYVSISVTTFTNSVGMLVDTQTWQIVDAKAFGTGWTYTSSKLTDYGSGWYRAELTFTPPAATAVIPRISGTASSTYSSPSPSYTGTNSTIILWGAQLEAGSFATSYIPTTTASVVRSADVCSIAAGPFATFYNPAGGTLATTQTVNTISTLSTPEVCRIVGSVGQFQFGTTNLTNEALRFFSVGSVTRSLRTGTRASGVQFKTAMAFANNDLAACLDNGSVLTDTTTQNIPIGVSMTIGFNAACMHIARLQYFKKRLSNAKLQALTV